MTLDADLGIDSIKRVEILSALQDRVPTAPTLKPEQLGTLRTLGQIAEALGDPSSVADSASLERASQERPDAKAACGTGDRGVSENGAERISPSDDGSVPTGRVVPDHRALTVENGKPGDVGSGAVPESRPRAALPACRHPGRAVEPPRYPAARRWHGLDYR